MSKPKWQRVGSSLHKGSVKGVEGWPRGKQSSLRKRRLSYTCLAYSRMRLASIIVSQRRLWEKWGNGSISYRSWGESETGQISPLSQTSLLCSTSGTSLPPPTLRHTVPKHWRPGPRAYPKIRRLHLLGYALRSYVYQHRWETLLDLGLPIQSSPPDWSALANLAPGNPVSPSTSAKAVPPLRTTQRRDLWCWTPARGQFPSIVDPLPFFFSTSSPLIGASVS